MRIAVTKKPYADRSDTGNGAHGSSRQTPRPPACGGRSHVPSAPAPPGTADSDPADNDSGRKSLRRTLGWTPRTVVVGFAQDLLGELAFSGNSREWSTAKRTCQERRRHALLGGHGSHRGKTARRGCNLPQAVREKGASLGCPATRR